MKPLEVALRKHLDCAHEPFHGHGVPTITALSEETRTAAGSVLFHAIANELVTLPEHTRRPMTITDQEYAAFVEVHGA